MKGQHLLVRKAESGDSAALDELLGAISPSREPRDEVWIGKLVGDVVAALVLKMDGSSCSIAFIYVRPDLRLKRIGTFLLRSVLTDLDRLGVVRVTVENAETTRGFLLRNGFIDTGEFLVRKNSLL